jgi:phage terminase small subunit
MARQDSVPVARLWNGHHAGWCGDILPSPIKRLVPANGRFCMWGDPVENRFFEKEYTLKRSTPTPTKHLRPETNKWFSSVLEEYELEEHHIKLLTLACENWDRATLAREAIATHGLTYTDRFSSPRKSPEVSIAEAATIAFARLTRELDLDCGPPATAPPPPSIYSNRRQ